MMIPGYDYQLKTIAHDFCRNRRNHGFILWTALLTIFVLSTLVFAFNMTSRNEARLAHHSRIIETLDLLARSSIEAVLSKLNDGFVEQLMTKTHGLFSGAPQNEGTIVSMESELCNQLKKDLNIFLKQLDEIAFIDGLGTRLPECTDLKIDFVVGKPLIPDFKPQMSRDPFEIMGEIIISCTILHHGIKRTVVSSRGFKIVSMVPGPYCRFSLFVPFTPWEFSYNALGVDYAGSVDQSYTHSWPKPMHFSGPLVIKNAPEPQNVPATDDEAELERNGWVFLGPAPKQASNERSEPFFLKLPSGYDADSGGNFHYMMPPYLAGKFEIVIPERIVDPENLRTSEELGYAPFRFGSKYDGFFTSQAGSRQGASGLMLWDAVRGPRWLCASTWVMPYGNRSHPSRTLIIGPALVGYLKSYLLIGKDNAGKGFAGIISGQTSMAAYDPISPMITHPIGALPVDYTYRAMFKRPESAADSFPLAWISYQTVYPYSSIPAWTPQGVTPVAKPVAFNKLFDFMKYQRSADPDKPFPSMYQPPSISGTLYDQKPRSVPSAAKMRDTALTGNVSGLHPSENVKIMLPPSSFVPDSSNDAVYFHGNLKDYNIQDGNKESLYRRVTHIIDLASSPSHQEGQKRFQDSLFLPSSDRDSCGKGFWIPRQSGIFYVNRLSENQIEDDQMPALELPGKIFVDKSLILVIGKGHLIVKNLITTEDQANLFSIVMASGDILIDPKATEIHAYLAALRPGNGFSAGGARILSTNPVEATPLNIFGGLAAWEVGLYFNKDQDPRFDKGNTMESFRAGGSVTFNTYFNPSYQLYERSRTLILEDNPWSTNFKGGGG